MTGPAQTPAHHTTADAIARHLATVDGQLDELARRMGLDARAAAQTATYARRRMKYRRSLALRLAAARAKESKT